MTTLEHNKYLGWAHIIYASSFTLLIGVFMTFFCFIFLGTAGQFENGHGAPPPELFLIMFLFVFLVNFTLLVPSFIAGYGLLKRKRWARNWGIAAGIISMLSFPIGVAVGVYSLWFLFGEQGKNLYTRRLESIESTPDVYLPPSNPHGWQ